MIKLDQKLELIVPLFDNDGVKINDHSIYSMLNSITKIAGGATVYTVGGQWIGENGHVMRDQNQKYEWYADKFTLETILDTRYIDSIIFDLLNEYGQEAVSMIINGTLYIIDDIDDLQQFREVEL